MGCTAQKQSKREHMHISKDLSTLDSHRETMSSPTNSSTSTVATAHKNIAGVPLIHTISLEGTTLCASSFYCF